MALVSISKKRPQAAAFASCPFRRMFSVVVIDKFFLLGVCAALFGSLLLGVPLWLMRSGIIQAHSAYQSTRNLHALVQIYFFLVPFILGFYIQSAPRIFETGEMLPRWVALTLPGSILAAVLFVLMPHALIPKLLLSANCFTVLAAVLLQLPKTSLEIHLRVGFFSALGLTILSCGPFWDLADSSDSLLLFWLGIVPIVLATSQQFIAGVLGGKRASPAQNAMTLVLIISSGAALLGQLTSLFCALALGAIASFAIGTGFFSALKHWQEPLGLTFILSHCWAIVGILLASFSTADAALHALALGYAVTLILGVSLRLTAWLTDTPEPSPARSITLLTLWQLFVFTRSFDGTLTLSPLMTAAASLACALALSAWAIALLGRVLAALRAQLAAIKSASHDPGQSSETSY
ncbi:MAG: NnrS family protein [Oligoflexia bacterium]|nr:NnrS family protein [Oligoflexia bacterium]